MAYVVGLLTPEEEKELLRRGWELEPAPASLVPSQEDCVHPERMRMVFVDQSMFNVMDGPDWDKGPPVGDCPHGSDPDHCPEEECFDRKQAAKRAEVGGSDVVAT